MIRLRTVSALAAGAAAALALGGAALAAGRDDPSSSSAPPSPSSASASSAGAIGLDAARAIAIKAAVWDIEVRKGGIEHDIDVDRATGDVLRHRSEADDDHGSDD